MDREMRRGMRRRRRVVGRRGMKRRRVVWRRGIEIGMGSGRRMHGRGKEMVKRYEGWRK